MKSLDEIHEMIQNAREFPGNSTLDICQSLLEQLRDVQRRIEVLDNDKADRPYDPKARF